MHTGDPAPMKISKHQKTHISFSQDEYERLKNDAVRYRKSIPDIIKAVYFRRELAPPLMDPVDTRKVMAELNRIGNNVNQIARQLNSGVREGFHPLVEDVRNDIGALRRRIMGTDGDCKN